MSTGDLILRTSGPDETRRLAAAVAPLFRGGDVVSLTGELGAGKTCFVQGAAGALGVQRRVLSPAFLLVREYPEADPPLVHADVYRLDRLQEVLDLGEDVMSPERLTFLEWGDAVASLLPDDRLEVELHLDDDPKDLSHRTVVLRSHGDWMLRLPDLEAAVAPWRETASSTATPTADPEQA